MNFLLFALRVAPQYRFCDMEYEAVPLHQHKHYANTCIDILNDEWPRSKAARHHSLEKSCDDLPCTLVFRRKNDHEVVGSSRLVSVQGKDKACLFESVIIRRDLRGTGLGKKLMEATEEFARKMNFKTAYLNTIDKQGFYSHLGYTVCSPVISLGDNAHRVPAELLQKLMGASISSTENIVSEIEPAVTTDITEDFNVSAIPAPAQPVSSLAPPLPHMSSAPPPRPPPPQGTSSKTDSVQSRHVVRMDPNAHTWMLKSL